MDGTTDRRHLTAARALVLEILSDAGPLTSEQIVTEWIARRPDMSARHLQQLPRMLSEILWRLTNLEWVTHDGHSYRITADGARMRAHLPAPHDRGWSGEAARIVASEDSRADVANVAARIR